MAGSEDFTVDERAPETYSVPSSVATRPIADELILLNNATETYFSLDQIGAAMFNELAAGRSTDSIVSTICGTYDGAEPSRVAADLADLIQSLMDKQLIEASGSN